MDLEGRYSIRKDIAWQEYFGTLYVFDDISRESYTLEDLASAIWKIISGSKDILLSDIKAQVKSMYPDIASKTIDDDVNEFIMDLLDSGLVVKHE